MIYDLIRGPVSIAIIWFIVMSLIGGGVNLLEGGWSDAITVLVITAVASFSIATYRNIEKQVTKAQQQKAEELEARAKDREEMAKLSKTQQELSKTQQELFESLQEFEDRIDKDIAELRQGQTQILEILESRTKS